MLNTIAILLCLWLIFSGYFKTFFLVAGFLSCLLVLGVIKLQNLPIYRIPFSSAKYILWLFYQMALSSWEVTKLVWQIKPKLSPSIKRITHDQSNSVKVAILANSITLTPGTLTIYHDEEHLYVHALVEDYFEGIDDIKKQISPDKKYEEQT